MNRVDFITLTFGILVDGFCYNYDAIKVSRMILILRIITLFNGSIFLRDRYMESAFYQMINEKYDLTISDLNTKKQT